MVLYLLVLPPLRSAASTMRFTKRSSVLSLLCAFSAVQKAAGLSVPRETPLGYKSTGKHGAVASEVAVCSEAGLEMLQKGGSAADAVSGTLFKPINPTWGS